MNLTLRIMRLLGAKIHADAAGRLCLVRHNGHHYFRGSESAEEFLTMVVEKMEVAQ